MAWQDPPGMMKGGGLMLVELIVNPVHLDTHLFWGNNFD